MLRSVGAGISSSPCPSTTAGGRDRPSRRRPRGDEPPARMRMAEGRADPPVGREAVVDAEPGAFAYRHEVDRSTCHGISNPRSAPTNCIIPSTTAVRTGARR
jgi:hypothetical protein